MSRPQFPRSSAHYRPQFAACLLLLAAIAFPGAVSAADDADSKAIGAVRQPRLASDAEQETWRRLHEPTVVDFIELSLEDAVSYLADYHRLEIRFDEPALRGMVRDRDQKVTLRLRGAPLHRVLKLLLRPFAVDYVIEGRNLVATTLDAAERRANDWIYDVHDLLRGGIAPDELTEAIVATVDAPTWERAGGIATVRIEENDLIVRQSSKTRERLDRFLRQIRAALQEGARNSAPAPTRSRTYRIDDLRVVPRVDGDLAEVLSDPVLTDLLRSAVLPPTWRTRGGEGLMDLRDGRLLVRQTDEGHRALAEFLVMLRAGLDEQPFPLSKSQVEISAGMAWELKSDPLATNAALLRPQSFQYDEVPWPRIFRGILKGAGVQALISRDPMVTLGINENEKRSLHANREPLSSCLDRLADSVGVDWYVNEVGGVLITTPELAAPSREIRLHSMAGCLSRGITKAELITRITSAVAPRSWADTDSPVATRPLGNFLVVNHNRRRQDEVARLLKSMDGK